MNMRKVWAWAMAAAVCAALAGCGQTEETVEEEQYLTIGAAAEGAFDLLVNNATGQDITAFAMKTGVEETYPASMMGSEDVWKNGETAEVFYLPEETEEMEMETETDVVFQPSYQAQVTLADGSVYELTALGLEDLDGEVSLCMEEEVLYVTYTSKTSGDTVSTKEQEMAAIAQQKAMEEAEAQAESQAAQEPAQSAPAQSEPVQTAPAQQPVQSAPVEQIPEQTTEGCLTEGGGPVFN
ncbi:hypothetical protein H9X85_04960 [Anaerotignum lactatifermentans]|uniref:Uncharacterized protein n=1 Tax=Anaerotignum lactatifermentans TaxID=160404 RepID=A0ABS2G8M5_9FIRM|nr:hypothetical protein [Anaerotignum lactatifermentans]MBM6828824.1 hypothetical protein [Anaerotignum lactatifermentans]MBM6877003.1 hypothetical protein [Anaerotignum lactatifermentans]MBM6950561.1 hypothetical protein [Anaerotignum lactatifermentans]